MSTAKFVTSTQNSEVFENIGTTSAAPAGTAIAPNLPNRSFAAKTSNQTMTRIPNSHQQSYNGHNNHSNIIQSGNIEEISKLMILSNSSATATSTTSTTQAQFISFLDVLSATTTLSNSAKSKKIKLQTDVATGILKRMQGHVVGNSTNTHKAVTNIDSLTPNIPNIIPTRLLARAIMVLGRLQPVLPVQIGSAGIKGIKGGGSCIQTTSSPASTSQNHSIEVLLHITYLVLHKALQENLTTSSNSFSPKDFANTLWGLAKAPKFSTISQNSKMILTQALSELNLSELNLSSHSKSSLTSSSSSGASGITPTGTSLPKQHESNYAAQSSTGSSSTIIQLSTKEKQFYVQAFHDILKDEIQYGGKNSDGTSYLKPIDMANVLWAFGKLNIMPEIIVNGFSPPDDGIMATDVNSDYVNNMNNKKAMGRSTMEKNTRYLQNLKLIFETQSLKVIDLIGIKNFQTQEIIMIMSAFNTYSDAVLKMNSSIKIGINQSDTYISLSSVFAEKILKLADVTVRHHCSPPTGAAAATVGIQTTAQNKNHDDSNSSKISSLMAPPAAPPNRRGPSTALHDFDTLKPQEIGQFLTMFLHHSIRKDVKDRIVDKILKRFEVLLRNAVEDYMLRSTNGASIHKAATNQKKQNLLNSQDLTTVINALSRGGTYGGVQDSGLSAGGVSSGPSSAGGGILQQENNNITMSTMSTTLQQEKNNISTKLKVEKYYLERAKTSAAPLKCGDLWEYNNEMVGWVGGNGLAGNNGFHGDSGNGSVSTSAEKQQDGINLNVKSLKNNTNNTNYLAKYLNLFTKDPNFVNMLKYDTKRIDTACYIICMWSFANAECRDICRELVGFSNLGRDINYSESGGGFGQQGPHDAKKPQQSCSIIENTTLKNIDKPVHIANLIHSMGLMQLRNDEIINYCLGESSKGIQLDLKRWKHEEITSLLWGLCSLGYDIRNGSNPYQTPSTVSTVSTAVQTPIKHNTEKETRSTQVPTNINKFTQKLFTYLTTIQHQLSPRHLSNALWCLATLGFEEFSQFKQFEYNEKTFWNPIWNAQLYQVWLVDHFGNLLNVTSKENISSFNPTLNIIQLRAAFLQQAEQQPIVSSAKHGFVCDELRKSLKDGLVKKKQGKEMKRRVESQVIRSNDGIVGDDDVLKNSADIEIEAILESFRNSCDAIASPGINDNHVPIHVNTIDTDTDTKTQTIQTTQNPTETITLPTVEKLTKLKEFMRLLGRYNDGHDVKIVNEINADGSGLFVDIGVLCEYGLSADGNSNKSFKLAVEINGKEHYVEQVGSTDSTTSLFSVGLNHKTTKAATPNNMNVQFELKKKKVPHGKTNLKKKILENLGWIYVGLDADELSDYHKIWKMQQYGNSNRNSSRNSSSSSKI